MLQQYATIDYDGRFTAFPEVNGSVYSLAPVVSSRIGLTPEISPVV